MFALVDIHTRPKAAKEEIDALDDVVKDALAHFPGEKDIITLGDFNAGCDTFDPALRASKFQSPDYRWIIPDDADTTIAKRPCPYDRIVMPKSSTSKDFTGEWGVERFDTEFGLSEDQGNDVSDHYPVWAKFKTGSDTDHAPST